MLNDLFTEYDIGLVSSYVEWLVTGATCWIVNTHYLRNTWFHSFWGVNCIYYTLLNLSVFWLCLSINVLFAFCLPGFSKTAPWAFIWFLDGNENKVVISIVGTNGTFFLINAHGVLRRMGAVTEIPGSLTASFWMYVMISGWLTLWWGLWLGPSRGIVRVYSVGRGATPVVLINLLVNSSHSEMIIYTIIAKYMYNSIMHNNIKIRWMSTITHFWI